MRTFLARMIALAWLLIAAVPALAQSAIATDNQSVSVTTGLTYQTIQAINQSRRSVTIQNNNTTSTENCWINVDGTVAAGATTATSVTVKGVSITAAKASILLQPGQAYTRYYPYVPSGAIVGTCTSTGDSIYADIQ
jgi:predicted transcriptional regulator